MENAEAFIIALKDSSAESPLFFHAGQEIDLTLPGNMSMKLVSRSNKGVKLWREKHPDRMSSSIVVKSDEIHLDIEQRKGLNLLSSRMLGRGDIEQWVRENVTREQVFSVLPVTSSIFQVLYWG